MFKHILIPTDGSPASAKAIKAGVVLAKEMGARVTGFYGAGASAYGYYGEPMLIEKRRYAEAGARVPCGREQHVAAVAKLAKVARVPFASLVSKAATPYEGIVAGRESAMSSSSPRTAGAAYRG